MPEFVFDWHRLRVPIDHPDGSVTNAKLDVGAPSGRLFFSDGTRLAWDDNLFWDNSSKRLGLGTTSPSQRLDVLGKVFVNSAVMIGGSEPGVGVDVAPMIDLGVGVVREWNAYKITRDQWGVMGLILVGGPAGDRKVHIWDSISVKGGTSTFDGSVGIGTTSPSERLDVSGNARVSGYADVGSLRVGGVEVIDSSRNLKNVTFDLGASSVRAIEAGLTVSTSYTVPSGTARIVFGQLRVNAPVTVDGAVGVA